MFMCNVLVCAHIRLVALCTYKCTLKQFCLIVRLSENAHSVSLLVLHEPLWMMHPQCLICTILVFDSVSVSSHSPLCTFVSQALSSSLCTFVFH